MIRKDVPALSGGYNRNGSDTMPDANITKNALASSMKKLMKEKAFSKISVIDICEGCGMNRKSFYYHFIQNSIRTAGIFLFQWENYSTGIRNFTGPL